MDSLKGTLTPLKVLNGILNGGIAYGTFNYNELENKPTINGIILQGNVVLFIPVKTSDLTNDSGFITSDDIPTKLSELINDAGFITITDVPTKLSELLNDVGFITLADIPAIPTNTSQLNNDSGFLTMNTTPVRSVNSQTGDVNLFIPNATSQLNNDAGFLSDSSQVITDIQDDVTTLQGDVSNLQGDVTTLSSADFTFTPASGVTASSVTTCKNDKLCIFSAEIRFTGNANTWTVLGTIDVTPAVSHVLSAGINTSNGSYLGMVEVRQDRTVRVYPTSNVSNGFVMFSLNFKIT